jgi:chromosome segregation ATPase
MSSFSEFFGRKGGAQAADRFAQAPAARQPQSDDRPETWADMGARIGGENEILRNLLVDTGRRIGALDDLKDAFGKLVDPISKTLRTLEQEKSENVSLRGTLSEVRQSYDTLRTEFNSLGQRAAAGETEIERLRNQLDIVQQQARSGEIAKGELNNELAVTRAKLADLERQLAQEVASTRLLTEENHTLSDHAASADKRIVELESENSVAHERVVLLENEKRSMQGSLDQLVTENSRLARKLTETENLLTAARGKIDSLEANLATSESERNRLTTAVDESNERRQTETNTLTMRLEAMQSRATAAERLLAEVRQSLITRTEENRVSERKVVEATIARNATEKKLEQMLSSLQQQERQLRDLEGSRATLVERSTTLLKTVKARETSLARAEEKIAALTDRVKFLEGEAETSRGKTEKRIEELNALLQRERLDRSVTEGALEATRKNYAELQRELAAERAGRGGRLEAVASEDSDAAKAKTKADKPASVEPIITP